MSEAYWAKIFFRDFLSHFIGMTKEEMGEDIAKSLKAVAKLDENSDCWGSVMVRSANDRMNGLAAQAHKESGKLGGRPKKTTEPAPAEEKAKPQKSKEKSIVQTKQKNTFGEFDNVSLTDDEISKLKVKCNQLGIDFSKVISTLSNYKAQSGKKYKSDYAAILQWVIDRCLEEKAKTNKCKSFEQIERENREAFFTKDRTQDDIRLVMEIENAKQDKLPF